MLLMVIGPLVIASLLLAICGGTLWDCLPIWHDEISYWNEMSVFRRAGWNGGYTVTNQATARANWVHFGSHGPFFPALFGTLTRVTGLRLWSIPVLNAALLTCCVAAWLATCRPSGAQSWIGALVVLTFWPLILYLPTSMQEVTHYALAFLLAAALVWAVRGSGSKPAIITTLLLVVAASQLRVTWCWLALGVLWIAWQPRSWLQWLGLLAIAAAVIGALYAEALWLYAPFPNFMREFLDGLAVAPGASLLLVVRHALKNMARYLSPTRDTWLQVGLRYQVLMLAGASAYHLMRLAEADRRQPRSTPAPNARLAFGFVLLNLACIVLFVIAMYDVMDWRDYRVVAPHLLLSLLVLVGSAARQWLGGYAIVSLVLGCLVPAQFLAFHAPRIAYDRGAIPAFGRQVSDFVRFNEGASGWDNTLLLHIDRLNSPLLTALPPGIGISIAYRWPDQPYPPRARYMLLTRMEAATLGVPAHYRRLVITPLGDIYERSEADRLAADRH
jgi:hypothetical protein